MRKANMIAFALFGLCLLFSTQSYSAVVDSFVGDAVESLSGVAWTVPASNQNGWVEQHYGPYDVTFVTGTWTSVYGGTYVFSTFGEANQAATQLIGALNTYNDDHPDARLTQLYSSTETNPSEAWVPFGPDSLFGVGFYKVSYGYSYPDQWGINPVFGSATPSSGAAPSWAFFQPATVPIPGALWLLGSGLIGIVGIRRKFKK